MKNFRVLFVLVTVLCMVTSISSCKKDDPDNNDPVAPIDTTGTGGNNTIDTTLMHWSATLEGTGFDGDTSSIAYTFEADHHNFVCQDEDGNTMTISLTDLAPGSYDIDFDNIILYSTATATYTGGFNPQGTLTITKNADMRISGHFAAVLFDFGTADELNLTNGVFNNLSYAP
jgi:hypothetical protein